MVEASTDYYRVFFSAREVDAGYGEVFLNALTRRAPPDVAAAMEAPLSLGELEGALRRMGRRKVPGLDGLPAEFYLKFWDVIGHILTAVRNGDLCGNGSVMAPN